MDSRDALSLIKYEFAGEQFPSTTSGFALQIAASDKSRDLHKYKNNEGQWNPRTRAVESRENGLDSALSLSIVSKFRFATDKLRSLLPNHSKSLGVN